MFYVLGTYITSYDCGSPCWDRPVVPVVDIYNASPVCVLIVKLPIHMLKKVVLPETYLWQLKVNLEWCPSLSGLRMLIHSHYYCFTMWLVHRYSRSKLQPQCFCEDTSESWFWLSNENCNHRKWFYGFLLSHNELDHENENKNVY